MVSLFLESSGQEYSNAIKEFRVSYCVEMGCAILPAALVMASEVCYTQSEESDLVLPNDIHLAPTLYCMGYKLKCLLG